MNARAEGGGGVVGQAFVKFCFRRSRAICFLLCVFRFYLFAHHGYCLCMLLKWLCLQLMWLCIPKLWPPPFADLSLCTALSLKFGEKGGL